MHDNSNVILEICSAIIITFNVDNVCATNRLWINQEAKCNSIEKTVLCSIYIQEKFSSSWMKENMGIQSKNVPEKICDKRKIRWNGIITNNK